MADFLLVHGSGHGAWCWRDVIPALAALGHMGRAIDLPGAGADKTPVGDVTLESCRDAVLAASSPDTIVVGHSWGGYPISAAGEYDPSAMRGLIFLCAYFPLCGLSMANMRKRAKRQLVIDAVRLDDARVSYTIDPSRVPDLFYNDCTPDIVDYALAHLCPQPIAPQNTPLSVGANFNALPKAYIRTACDQTIAPEFQTELTKDWPDEAVYTMNTSHSPFFSDPRGLAQLLVDIAGHF